MSGTSKIAIIIGTELPKSMELMTLSNMDMVPGLQATIFFEQIYRAYRFINNHTYHK
ncbi:23S rRNA (pseudouridine(1915)-N(3))-methyltransferase RlmH [Paenibacillus sp. NRS-1781]|uniref:23S rRNA (pseudouridine(1915)-N(3))-methyltransferase RlmH n=1 Tax=unclassified Paenibacillus TaxID=185978 RepID=UPI003D2DB1A6